MRALAIALIWLLTAGITMAAPLEDPAKEARAQALFQDLRCLVCQNQSIADSNAPLADDLRTLVRERIAAGDDEPAIKAFLVARYGEFILLKPPLNAHTWLLWAAPVLALLAGCALAARGLVRRRGSEPDAQSALSDAEARKLRELIDES